MDAPPSSLVTPGTFRPEGIYLDTPTYGLAPTTTADAMARAVASWQAGRATMADYDRAVDRSRQLYAGIVGADLDDVAIGANVSSLVGPVAAGIPDGSVVLVPEGEFTSLLFPLLVGDRLRVRTVPLDGLAGAVDASVDVVAFSLVQSSTGRVADADAITHAARTHGSRILVDATHAAGWLPFDPGAFDATFVAAYKWLLCPRGVAFMTAGAHLAAEPLNAGWYAGEDPWSSIYGAPLRLARSARRYDTSPAWLAWIGAVPSLELVAAVGVDRIHDHDVALADRVRERLGLEPARSAIVTIPTEQTDALARAGIAASLRHGAVRIGCHLHNSAEDVDAFAEVLLTP